MQQMRDQLTWWTTEASPPEPEGPAPAPAGMGSALGTAASMQPLLLLQAFDGSWELTTALADALGAELGRLMLGDEGEGDPPPHPAAWATALALAFLELRLPALAEEWALVAEKARAWLRGVSSDPEALVALACRQLDALGASRP